MRAITVIGLALLGQRGYLFPWAPVCLGGGIGLYFQLGAEPSTQLLWGAAGCAVVMMWLSRRCGPVLEPMVWAVMLLCTGIALAGLRSHIVAEPVMGWRYYGPVEGRIVGIDRSASDALRLTLADVRLSRVRPQKTPALVRISLHGEQGYFVAMPGQRIALTGHISPPQGPVEPGGFDFQRHAWFQRLGGVGYTRSPVLLLQPSQSNWSTFALRMRMSRHIRAQLPGEAGGFAAAVTTGDRSGISQSTLASLRDSNLAHLLAISGLHMGLLVGFVFAALRYGIALIPGIAMRVHSKRLAAALSILAATIYLILSGGNVSTQRAFVMATVALVAVIADRRVISLRAVAVAALIVLLVRPEALLSPGFHMSFAATVALVAVFSEMQRSETRIGPGWLQPVVALVLSSLVAGLATAPYGAAHFNQLAHYGLLANVLSVPVMGTLVIPAAVLSASLSIVGLDWIGIWLMGIGLNWILFVADWVSAMPGAKSAVISPGPLVLPLFSAGFLFVVLWQGHARWVGLVAVAVAFGMWIKTDRPPVLIAGNGALVGVMTGNGRALSKPKGHGFVARNWLENDGDATLQPAAADRWQKSGKGYDTKGVRMAKLGSYRLFHIQGKRALSGFKGCKSGDLVISSVQIDGTWPCRIFDPKRLRRTGALAVHVEEGKMQVMTSRHASGSRLWNSHGKHAQ